MAAAACPRTAASESLLFTIFWCMSEVYFGNHSHQNWNLQFCNCCLAKDSIG